MPDNDRRGFKPYCNNQHQDKKRKESEFVDIRENVPVEVVIQYPSGKFRTTVDWRDRKAVKDVTSKMTAAIYQGGSVITTGLSEPIMERRDKCEKVNINDRTIFRLKKETSTHVAG